MKNNFHTIAITLATLFVTFDISTAAAAARPQTATPPAEAVQETVPATLAQPRPSTRVYARSAAPAMAAVIAYGEGGQSYLGVDIQDITSDRVSALKLKEERGVEITLVDQDAPAGKAGLKEHDVILEFNGAKVESQEQLRRMLHETPSRRSVTLGISRDGQPMTIKVTLGDRGKEKWKVYAPGAHLAPMPPMPHVHVEMPDIEMPQIDVMVHSYSTGMMIDNLTPQLGEFFGVKGGEGILVRSVEKGSAAEAAGLKAGDIITKVDDERITGRNDWRRVIRNKSGKINIGIVRDKKEQNLSITLAPRRTPRPGKDNDSSFLFNFNGDFEMDQFSDMDPGADMDEEFDMDITRLHDIHNKVERELARVQPRIQRALVKVQSEAELKDKLARELAEKQSEMQHKLADVQKKVQEQMKMNQEKIAREMEKVQTRVRAIHSSMI